MADEFIDSIITISIDVSAEDRGDHWAACVEQLGITVYGDSMQAAVNRVDQMLNFIADTYQKHYTVDAFREYLDSHGVQHTIQKPSVIPTAHRMRREPRLLLGQAGVLSLA